jgi:aminoglycoside phosphotransferase (APT) family kinase protein
VARAYRFEAELGAVALAPIHGDFHLGQVHLHDGRAWLMDFDALCYADPAADLGNVLVFLKARARKNPAILELTDVFLEEYYSRTGWSLAKRIPLYEGLTNLRRACKALRLGEDGWERNATRLVEAAAASIG